MITASPEKTKTSVSLNKAPDWIRYLYCDLSGVIRGKAAYKYANTKKKLMDGAAVSRGILALNFADMMQSHNEFGAVGDLMLKPDNDRYINVTYPQNTGVLLCDLEEEDGADYDCCPRTILKKQIERAKNMGLYFEAAFEPEFYLYKRDHYDHIVPIDRSRAFSSQGMNEAAAFIDSFAKALTDAGMIVEQYNAEHGQGQHELSVRHTEALSSADNHLLYREILRSQASAFNIIASLAPKPSMNAAGSGCHVHLSAWHSSSKTNAFVEKGELSKLAKSFIAGVLNHLPAIVAFGCSSVNSFDRIQPQSASSAYSCWGLRNREAAIRVPPPVDKDAGASTNLELRFVDNSCNPHLILAALIAAGLEGIQEGHTPPEPIDCDPSHLDPQTLHEMQVYPLPSSLMDAALALEHDAFMRQVFGDKFLHLYCTLKQSEHDHFSAMSFEERVEHHLTAF